MTAHANEPVVRAFCAAMLAWGHEPVTGQSLDWWLGQLREAVREVASRMDPIIGGDVVEAASLVGLRAARLAEAAGMRVSPSEPAMPAVRCVNCERTEQTNAELRKLLAHVHSMTAGGANE